MQNDKTRHKTRVAVYLVALQDQKVLLAKRKNTGHMDGHWSLIAGHVYEGESSTHAMIREAQEECGLLFTSNCLLLVGAMHHYSYPFDYINFIFTANLKGQEPKNLELDKCDALEFYDVEDLPSPITDYIREIIQKSISGKYWVSEFGWDQ